MYESSQATGASWTSQQINLQNWTGAGQWGHLGSVLQWRAHQPQNQQPPGAIPWTQIQKSFILKSRACQESGSQTQHTIPHWQIHRGAVKVRRPDLSLMCVTNKNSPKNWSSCCLMSNASAQNWPWTSGGSIWEKMVAWDWPAQDLIPLWKNSNWNTTLIPLTIPCCSIMKPYWTWIERCRCPITYMPPKVFQNA